MLKNYEDFQTEQSSNRFGNCILAPQARLRGLYFTRITKGETIFRPWPTIEKTESGLREVHWRSNKGFGKGFFVQDVVCRNWGVDRQITCFRDVRDYSEWPNGSPCKMFYDVLSAIPEYKALFEWGKRGLSKPNVCGFLKGIIARNGGKDISPPRMGVVLALSYSVKEAFENLILETIPGKTLQWDEKNPAACDEMYVLGNPVALKNPFVFKFFLDSACGRGDEINFAEAPRDRRAALEQTANQRGEMQTQKGSAEVIKNKTAILDINAVYEHDQSFEEAFWYMTGEEQLKTVLIPAFGRTRPDLLREVFEPRHLPQSIVSGKVFIDTAQTTAVPIPTAQSVKPDEGIDFGSAASGADTSFNMPSPDEVGSVLPFDIDNGSSGQKGDELPISQTALEIQERLQNLRNRSR